MHFISWIMIENWNVWSCYGLASKHINYICILYIVTYPFITIKQTQCCVNRTSSGCAIHYPCRHVMHYVNASTSKILTYNYFVTTKVYIQTKL